MATLINDQEALRRDEEKKQKLSPLQQIMQNAPGLSTSDPQANIPSRITPVGPAAQPAISQEDNLSMLDSMITRPLTPDDINRRKRAATSVAAIGQLGNLISAYSNLAGTTGGAAPQVIPGYQGPDVTGWADRAQQKQMEYANMMNALTTQDWQMARQAELDRQNKERLDRELKMKEDNAIWQRDYTKQRDEIEDAQKKAALEETKRHNKAAEANAADALGVREDNLEWQKQKFHEASNAKMGLSPDGRPITKRVFGADGKVYDFDEYSLYTKLGSGNNAQTLSSTASQLYDKLPADMKKEYTRERWREIVNNASTAAEAISLAIEKDMDFFETVRKLGLLAPANGTPMAAAANNQQPATSGYAADIYKPNTGQTLTF